MARTDTTHKKYRPLLAIIVKMSTEISPASTIFSYLPHPNPSQPPIPSALPSSKPMVYCSDHSHCARKSGVNIHNATGNENLVPNPATFARTSSSDLPFSHVALHYPIASHRILCTQRKHQPHCAATSPSDSTHCQLPRATPHSDRTYAYFSHAAEKEKKDKDPTTNSNYNLWYCCQSSTNWFDKREQGDRQKEKRLPSSLHPHSLRKMLPYWW